MDDETTQQPQQQPPRGRRWARSAALVGGGLVAGGILAGTLTANAATDEGTAPSTTEGTAADCPGGRGDEEPLTGDTADSVTDAVLTEYPDATIQRLETDSDGVYEAHIVTTDDERLTVELDESFAITGTETHEPGRGPGHRGGPRDDASPENTAPEDDGAPETTPEDDGSTD